MIIGYHILHHLGDALTVSATVVCEGLRRARVPAISPLWDDHNEAILICCRHNATAYRFSENATGSPAPVVQEHQDRRVRRHSVWHVNIHAEIGWHAAGTQVGDQLERSRLRWQRCKKSETNCE